MYLAGSDNHGQIIPSGNAIEEEDQYFDDDEGISGEQ